ncbi:MAG: hypothetical protein ABI822_09130, partial [Bryobacteraceae bacterium]
GSPFAEALTPRFWDICDDVMGVGRWNAFHSLGWWPVNFPGFATGPWQAPQTFCVTSLPGASGNCAGSNRAAEQKRATDLSMRDGECIRN